MPMSGVRLQLLPWHGELSTRSLAPAASTAGWLASMAIAGSLEALGRYGVGGLPTVTLLSADTALASVGTAKATIPNTNTTRMTARRAIVLLLSWRLDRAYRSCLTTRQLERIESGPSDRGCSRRTEPCANAAGRPRVL